MKKILTVIITFILVFIFLMIIILSITGFKTNKFNNFISQKIYQNNQSVKVEFEEIKFKLDIKETSLFLETLNPKIYYRNIQMPVKNIKVYIDFISMIKSKTEIDKIILNLDLIDINQLKMLSKTFKPSNLTSFIKNKIKHGKIDAEIEFYLDEENSLNNFITRGNVTDLRTEVIKGLELSNASFSFLADNTDIIVKNLFADNEYFTLQEGDLKASFSNEIIIETNFKSILNLNYNSKKNEKFLSNLSNYKYLSSIRANLNNNLKLEFDKTYKLKNFDFRNKGKIIKADLSLKDFKLDYLVGEKINQLSFIETDIQTNLSSKKNFFNLSGKYSLNNNNILNFKISNTFNKELINMELIADYDELLNLKILNYLKKKGDIANIKLNFIKKKNSLKISHLSFDDNRNSLKLKNASFNKSKLISLQDLSVKTYKNGKKNNDFSIMINNNISIKGEQFDASYLPKILNKKNNDYFFSKISKDIEIDFKNITTPLSKKLKKFKLIGKIEKGKFIKITSKGDFGNNNFLDITLKTNKNNKKKYLEIYSDVTKPLLTEYNFFRGLTGGKLIFTSIIEDNSSNSKLKIENFKVINAPGMVKLLSLADLGGLADLAEGEGITFNILEINMEKNSNTLKLNEILALGPSISVLMEGYQDKNVTSLRGTLVPAKTLNKLISKIPVIGDIIIPKEIGEGLFGISFKMKGPPGKIKTTINPIRTITPRFIQKIIDKKRKAN